MPGLVDAHVHLAFGAPADMLAAGVVALRDLGAPPVAAACWRTRAGAPGDGPLVAVAGPLLTAPGGYPSTSWGRAGFSRFLRDAADAQAAVEELATSGVDLVKLALEPAGGLPVPSAEVAGAVVRAAHGRGLAVTAHALSAAMVERALDAGVDELCHTPLEPMPQQLVDRLADAGVTVVSTLHTHAAHPPALDNARSLVAAGVPLVYGTDLGNAGTRTGAEPRELRLLAAAGLGVQGALDAATAGSGGVAGLAGRGSGALRVGSPAYAVVLSGDPVLNLEVLRTPLAAVAGVGCRVMTPRRGRWRRSWRR